MAKRYYWLKLQSDFFDSKRIKKLRQMAGGDTYTIIYLKMQLLAIKTDGILTYTGLEDNFADELALDLDENPDDVRMTLAFLLRCGLAETSDDVNYLIPYAAINTGSEGVGAERVRKFREKQKALQGNADVTQVKRLCNVEKEIEEELDIEEEKKESIKKEKRFAPPSPQEVDSYIKGLGLSIDAERFCDFYASKNWMVGKSKMADWRAAARNWARRDRGVAPQEQSREVVDAEVDEMQAFLKSLREI